LNILGLEASTSSAKAVIYSTEEGVIKVITSPYGEDISDVVSQDADGMYNALINCAREALTGEALDIHGISITTTWHSLLFLDNARQPIGRIYTWADTSPAETVKRYRADGRFSSWFYHKTGCGIHSTYPIWKCMHLKETDPSMLHRIHYISSQQEYIFEKLTGEGVVSTTVASGTGFFNIHTLKWDEELLDMAGINLNTLSSIKEPEYKAPLCKEAADIMGLPEGIPVILGGADGALNQIGAGGMGEGIMTLSVGTSGALRMATSEPILPHYPSTWCYYLAEGKRIAGAATAGAGNCVNWFRNKWQYGFKELEHMIKSADIKKVDDAPFFMPFLYGERCPGWNDERLGGFLDIKGSHDIGQLYYAVLEGILFNLYHCYSILTDIMAEPDEIRISGGITHSDLWLSMAADMFEKDMVTSEIEHASILGGIALALKSLGYMDSLAEFTPNLGKVVKPRAGMANFYKKRFDRYIELYND
jgi:gluconokinase